MTKFQSSGQAKDLQEFSRLAKLNPLDQSIAISKRMQALDEKTREKLLDLQRVAQQKSVLEAMKTGNYDNAAFLSMRGDAPVSAYQGTGYNLATSQNLDAATLRALQVAGGSAKRLAKGGKKPTLKKQNMKFANPLPNKKALEQQLLLQALGIAPKLSNDFSAAAGAAWDGSNWRT